MDYGFCYEWLVCVDEETGNEYWETTKPKWYNTKEEMLEAAKYYRDCGEWENLPDEQINVMYFVEIDPEDV